ncbi:hypothetical protein [Streptomyces sp. NPDC058989]|uniref:protein kinase domain-containing protein n=1 Tax=Streptomyces sp. NPDC058989 TaxID=3346686 RepID=UPI0036B6C6C1
MARHHADTKITMTGAVVGTATYVAPERLKGVESPAGDLWSLGVALYQVTTGLCPFDRGSALSTIHAVSHDQPDEPVGAGHLTAVITALLDKDPKPGPASTLCCTTGDNGRQHAKPAAKQGERMPASVRAAQRTGMRVWACAISLTP